MLQVENINVELKDYPNIGKTGWMNLCNFYFLEGEDFVSLLCSGNIFWGSLNV